MPTTNTAHDEALRIDAHLHGLLDGPAERVAVLIVDPQNDFCDDYEPATLAVPGGGRTAAVVRALLAVRRFDVVAVSRDYHIDPGAHFAEQPDYVDTWPAHCVAGTQGAELHPDLHAALAERPYNALVSKGMLAAAYSAFDPQAAVEDRAGHTHSGGLAEFLREQLVDTVVVVGIETAHCVAASVVDAATAGFRVIVPLAGTASLDDDASAKAVARMLAAGNVTVFGWPR